MNTKAFLLLTALATTVLIPLKAEYYSQVGQDKFLNENYFHNKRNGVFVDIGAYDGITISNSYFFEKNLNWHGICIEPIPEVYKTLRKNRSCICLNCCVSETNGIVEFLYVHSPIVGVASMASGIERNYQDHIGALNNFVEKYDGVVERIKVPSRILNDILQEHKLYIIDLLSIDTEGADFDILKSIDYKKYKINFIVIENNFKDLAVREFMQTKGFKLEAVLEQDEIYRNINF